MNLPILTLDKANHLIYGLVLSSAALFLTLFLFPNIMLLVVAAPLAIAALAGLAKEYLDKRSRDSDIKLGKKPSHSVDSLDIIYTTIGGVVTVGNYLLLKFLMH